MRNLILVLVLLLCGLAIWRPSLRGIGIGLVVLALIGIAGVGRLGIGFVRPPSPRPKPDPSVGIRADIEVAPTIDDIRTRRDVVLLKAIELIGQKPAN